MGLSWEDKLCLAMTIGVDKGHEYSREMSKIITKCHQLENLSRRRPAEDAVSLLLINCILKVKEFADGSCCGANNLKLEVCYTLNSFVYMELADRM